MVLSELGRGAMGVVVAAYDPKLERRVAIKLIREASANPEATARFLREAQALARLNHPNVVAVHDVGEYEQHVFIAMELVDGETLGSWSRTRRDWKDTIAVYRQAAQGLAAAHAAGIVHRDFKPDNVMIANDGTGLPGRVRVMDFGLANEDTTTKDATPDSLVDLTLTGSVMGTPAYMSPEQFAAKPLTAASDQFSYCISLYEALVGERPFKAGTFAELAASVSAGRTRPVPRSCPVPAGVLRLVLRGLEVDPAARHPSMDALHAALGRIEHRRHMVLAGVSVIGLTGLVAAASTGPDPDAPCAEETERLYEAWSEGRADELKQAFFELGIRGSQISWNSTKTALDEFATQWSEQYEHVCRSWRQTLPPGQLEARRQCLLSQREHLTELLDALGQPDEKTLRNAVAASQGLPGPKQCEQASLVATRDDWRPALQRSQRTLAQARARREIGDTTLAISYVEQAEQALDGLDLPRARARVLLERATLERRSDTPEDAHATLQEAMREAARAGDDAFVAKLWLSRIRYIPSTPVQSLRHKQHLLEAAEVAVQRAGGNDRETAGLLALRGMLKLQQGDAQDALEPLNQAIEVGRRGDTLPGYLASYIDILGQAKAALGDNRGANAAMTESLQLMLRTYGPAYPPITTHRGNVGSSCMSLGDFECARTQFEAIESLLDDFGDDSDERTLNFLRLAQLDHFEGSSKSALEHATLALTRAEAGSDKYDIATYARELLFEVSLQESDFAAASTHADALTDAYHRGRPKTHPQYEHGQELRGRVLIEQGRYAQAIEALERLIAHLESISANRASLANGLRHLSHAHRGLGHDAEALRFAERALQVLEDDPRSATERAAVEVVLADLLWASDRDRSTRLARQAWASYRAPGPGHRQNRESLARWFAERDLSPGIELER